ncbi:MAG: carboxypeptidase-like regulatory domain-containing protein [Planctomycetota bacterium]|nr:carboxypeptidase-like regulatory domain-containing protein [Planctomycetota bacterium]
MNTSVKIAAVVSVLFFGAIIGIFLATDSGTEVNDAVEVVGVEETTAPEGKAEPDKDAGKFRRVGREEKIVRGSVKVSVEVREKARDRVLRNAKVRVFRKSETDRIGSEIDLQSLGGVEGKAGNVAFALEPGSYEVMAQCAGYTGNSMDIVLVKDQVPQALVFKLERGTSISGIVLDRGGKPVPGAKVFAFKELADPDEDMEGLLRKMVDLEKLNAEVHSETVTGPDGKFQLDGLESYWYSIRAVAATFSPGTVSEVRAPREGLKLVLEKGGVFEGLVKGEGGGPVSGAKVMAYVEPVDVGLFDVIMMKNRPPVEEFETGSDGKFKLQSLGAGLYNFLVTAPMYQEHRELRLRILPGDNPAKVFDLKAGNLISGYVRGPDDEPVVGARVRANPVGVHVQPRDQIKIDFSQNDRFTDENGFFSFDTLIDARYMLMVSHEDYESLQRKDVQPSQEEVSLRLGPGGRLAGFVLDAQSNEPIAGATVSASDLANLRKEAVTDEEGAYIIGGLSSGRRPVNVYVRAENYARQKKQVAIRKGQEYEQIFELYQTGSVFGTVVNTAGDVIPGAHVEVRPASDAETTLRVLGNATSDRTGSFMIGNVEPGEELEVRVKMTGYLESYSGKFALASGQEVEIGNLEIQLGGEIQGVVSNSEGQPINGVWVEGRPEGGTDLVPGTSMQTSDGGKFLLRGLHKGKYELIAKGPGYVDSHTPDVEVREGTRNTGVKIVLEQGGKLAGVVVNTEDEPVQGAEVIVRDLGAGLKEHRVVSNGKGTFEFTSIIAEDFVELEINSKDYGTYRAEQVKVGSQDLRVELKPLAVIIGRVLDPAGNPAKSFTVRPQSKDGQARSGSRLRARNFNPTDGRFEYKGVGDGIYTLSIRSLQYAAVTLTDLRVEAGDVLDVGDIELSEGGTVSGVVVAAGTNEPVEGARVRVVQGARAFQPGKATSIVTTDAAGEFFFAGLKDQVLSLEVSHGNFAKERLSGVDPRISGKSQGLLVELAAAASISGVVVDSRRQAVKSIAVYLIGADKSTSATGGTTKTDREGVFEFLGVSPGNYTVKAHRFGNPPVSAEVQVQTVSGQHHEVVIELQSK